MAENKGTKVIAPIVTPSTDDKFPTHISNMGKGGYHSVQTLADRNATSTDRREEGMLCWVVAESVMYQLVGGLENSNWKIFNVGSGGASLEPRVEVLEQQTIQLDEYIASVDNNFSGETHRIDLDAFLLSERVDDNQQSIGDAMDEIRVIKGNSQYVIIKGFDDGTNGEINNPNEEYQAIWSEILQKSVNFNFGSLVGAVLGSDFVFNTTGLYLIQYNPSYYKTIAGKTELFINQSVNIGRSSQVSIEELNQRGSSFNCILLIDTPSTLKMMIKNITGKVIVEDYNSRITIVKIS